MEWRAHAGIAAMLLLAACGSSHDVDGEGLASAGGDWVTAWSTSPTDVGDSLPLAPGAVLRQFVSPHASGDVVRLRLSNRLGTQPVTLAQVTLGLQADGATLVDGSVAPLTFDGASQVTIPAGETVASDPVDFPVVPFHKIGVSFTPSEPLLLMQRHLRSFEVPWLATAGASPSDASGGSFVPIRIEQVYSWFLISGLEVRRGAAKHTVVALGDSITDGYVDILGAPVAEDPSIVGQDVRYPDFLQRRLIAAGRSELSAANAGIAGNRVNADGLTPDLGPSLRHRLQPDVLDQPTLRTVILLEGINDLGLQVAPDADAIVDGLGAAVTTLQSHGVRVVLGTILPARGFYAGPIYDPDGPISPGFLSGTEAVDTARLAINQWIRTSSSADAVADFDACLRDPEHPSYLLPAYDSGDHVHPNADGYAAMAECVDLDAL